MGAHGFADLCVRRGIDSAGGIIQNQHLRLLEQRAGDTQALFLAAGDIRAAALNAGVVFFRETLDKFIRAR